METFVGQAQLRVVRSLVGDPAGVDGRHEDAVVEHLLGARAGEHVQCGLGHVGVGVARALVGAAELALHRRDVHHVLPPSRGRRHRRTQPRDEDERRDRVAQLHLEQLDGIDLAHRLDPAVGVRQIGQQPAGVDRDTLLDPGRGCGTGDESEGTHLFGGQIRGRGQRGRGQRTGQRGRVRVAGLAERHDVGQLAGRQRPGLGVGQRAVRPGGAAHRLRSVVDQDVEGPLRRNGIGQRDHLRGIAQVDADHPQAVDPVGAVLHGLETPDGVVREPGGDRQVGAVAQQPQRDVHADLGAASGEQGPAPVRSVRWSRFA